MEIRVLGEVALYGPDGPVAIQRVGERILLAVLAINAGEDVEATTLLRLLGEGGVDQPIPRTLKDYVAAVRTALQGAGGSRAMLPDARRRRGAYRLEIDPNLVDYQRFQRHARAARDHADAGDDHAAVISLRQAISEWHGRPLAGIDRAPLDGLRHEMDDEYRAVARDLLTQQIHFGQYTDVVRAARRMVDKYPTDDIVVLALHALARDGRRVEIPHFRQFATGRLRALLDDDGADFGTSVRDVADALLKQPRESYRLLPRSAAVAATATGREGLRFSLPPDTIAFTGRTKELAAITDTVTAAVEHGGVVAIHAIDGMPGVGKTTLAVHAAHQLAERYPDRQLFVDLHAHTAGHQPTDPADALADLLRAVGVDPRQLPNRLDARAALWRDRMAERHALLVLDNAASTAQVAPLLPSSPNVLVLITSRRQLGDLRHAVHLQLKVLPHADAVAMFLRLAPRAAAEPEAVATLVQACEHLPLAIAIIASRFAAHHTWTMADLLTEVQTSRRRLLTVTSEDATVWAAFDLSYRYLPAERQRFFRLIGLTPGVDIDGYAGAALTGTTLEEAMDQLDELYHDHLLDETSPHRYRMHDLIRTYARSLGDPQDLPEQALDRLLDYYQHTADRADALIARHIRPTATAKAPAPAAAPDLPDWDRAIAWLRAERPNLLALLHHSTAHHRIIGLTAGLATILRTDGPLHQAADLHQRAAAAAHATDRLAHANALVDLGIMRRMTSDYPGAAILLGEALTAYQDLGDQRGQANALNELGRARQGTGDYPGSEDLLLRALTAYQGLGDQRGQANALDDLGIARRMAGDYPGATDLYQQALTTYQDLGDRIGQASVLDQLADVRTETGDYRGAADLCQRALSLYQDLGNRLGQSHCLSGLGRVRMMIGDYRSADDLLSQALAIYRRLGNRRGQANALYSLGVIRRMTGDFPGADDLLRQTLTSYEDLNSGHGAAYTRVQLGAVRYLTGDHIHAESLLQQALTALRDIGATDDEAEALNHLGTLRRLTGHPEDAHTHHQQALTLAIGIHDRLKQAQALEGIGHAALDLGQPATAATHLRQALDLYRLLGVPEEAQVATFLAELDSM